MEFLADERSTYYQETHGRGMDAAAKRQVRMAWTHQLIPSIDAWVSRKHGQVNFYLTQLLSGHGCFRSYLHRFGHADSAECSWCGHYVEEDAEHAIFSCAWFAAQRQRLEEALGGAVVKQSLVPCMLLSPENWEATSCFAATIMRELRAVEHQTRVQLV
ncbi:uncharacterized protein LOC117193783 [Drosophila miranda]|uniref:uncharacterized protein LOC117193783 n=1 Tax=Drosophila miranda TaxID=7229 RepID=UPI00143F0683|nr:uncharacterized protein LOC117193783 [Drosophila miranda]